MALSETSKNNRCVLISEQKQIHIKAGIFYFNIINFSIVSFHSCRTISYSYDIFHFTRLKLTKVRFARWSLKINGNFTKPRKFGWHQCRCKYTIKMSFVFCNINSILILFHFPVKSLNKFLLFVQEKNKKINKRYRSAFSSKAIILSISHSAVHKL